MQGCIYSEPSATLMEKSSSMTDDIFESSSASQETTKPKSSWGLIIKYFDGHAFGIDAKGQTIYMGREADVRAAISAPDLRSNFDPNIQIILELEARLIRAQEEQNRDGRPSDRDIRHRTSEIRRRSNQRIRSMRPTRRRRFNSRQFKKR
jgi:hypothetical protein